MESYKEQRARELQQAVDVGLTDLLRAAGLQYLADRRCRRVQQGISKDHAAFDLDAARGETIHAAHCWAKAAYDLAVHEGDEHNGKL